ncbi:unnamed protein product [Effrenium voratum]|uniref:Uncharacterized protein n=1 Tax=Effrenium voratum TaxID=2562239 RepID=A0AA36MQA7_9DINO|nr:unnamed protein product [Effrenium voratum]CAJ1381435.1 unnamed protein product [Effrenium voratum]CAJ1459396.1 unnamed protein product [Effrenium voratum]
MRCTPEVMDDLRRPCRRKDPRSHAWASHPEVFLSAEVWNRPEKGALAEWALGLEALAVKLKAVAAVLLRFIEDPENRTAAVQATLRSALHHCALVSHHEVLPAVRLFTLKSGAAPQEWRKGLARSPKPVRTRNILPHRHEADVLSDRQRAVLRSLQAASDLGVPEATQLAKEVAAHFYACAQLAKHARHVVRLGPSTPRTKGASLVDRWIQAPMRCKSAAEDPGPSPILQIGPVLCGGLDAAVMELAQGTEQIAEADKRSPHMRSEASKTPELQRKARRPSSARPRVKP